MNKSEISFDISSFQSGSINSLVPTLKAAVLVFFWTTEISSSESNFAIIDFFDIFYNLLFNIPYNTPLCKQCQPPIKNVVISMTYVLSHFVVVLIYCESIRGNIFEITSAQAFAISICSFCVPFADLKSI